MAWNNYHGASKSNSNCKIEDEKVEAILAMSTALLMMHSTAVQNQDDDKISHYLGC